MMNLNTGFWHELWISIDDLAIGTGIALSVSILAIILGTILGVLLGLALTYGNLIVRTLARIYVDIIRGIPVLVLILAFFYVLTIWGINLKPFQAGVLSLGVFSAAHVAEMTRGGLQNIHKGQSEASLALGLSFQQTFTAVLMPQALRQILPTWINTVIETVKGSTLVSIIGVVEITLVTQQIIARNFLTMKFYAVCALIYFCIGFSIERAGKYIEKKIAIK